MNTLTQTILDTVPVGALATVNRDRTPLVTPLHFARVGDAIAWLSDREARHSHNAFRTGRAEFVVWNDAKQAVYLHTTVREAREDEVAAMTEAYTAKLGNFRPQCAQPQWYVALIGQLDDNSTTENWVHYLAYNAIYSVQ